MRRPTWRRLLFAPAVGLLLCCAGCNIIGAAAQVLPHADIAPAYEGLAHQTVGVMVWVDRGVAIDYPSLQADVARSITNKLSETTNQKEKKKVPKEVVGAQYLDPMTVIRFQADHPELE